jgi:hypothetical protein
VLSVRQLCRTLNTAVATLTSSTITHLLALHNANTYHLSLFELTVLDENPGARLAFVGKGPMDGEMAKFFEGYPVHFAGQLIGTVCTVLFCSCHCVQPT